MVFSTDPLSAVARHAKAPWHQHLGQGAAKERGVHKKAVAVYSSAKDSIHCGASEVYFLDDRSVESFEPYKGLDGTVLLIPIGGHLDHLGFSSYAGDLDVYMYYDSRTSESFVVFLRSPAGKPVCIWMQKVQEPHHGKDEGSS